MKFRYDTSSSPKHCTSDLELDIQNYKSRQLCIFLVNCSVIMHVNTEIWLFPETAPSFPQTSIAAGPLSTGLLHTNWFVGFCAFSTMVLGIGWCSLCSLVLGTQCYLWIYNSWIVLWCYDFDKSHNFSVVYDQNSCLGFLLSTRCIRH